MRTFLLIPVTGLALLLVQASAWAAPTADAAQAANLVSQATQGRLKAVSGKYSSKDCNQSVEYDAEVVDLNGDGQPEVFTNERGTCMGGVAGNHMNLYIKGANGKWVAQFGFPGMYTVMKTRHLGYPDIEIGGPGTCFPVWRWNGQKYDTYKRCAR